MLRVGMCVAASVFGAVVAWLGVAHFVPVEAASPPPIAAAPPLPAIPLRADAKGVDLTALRDAIEGAAKKGENVDEIAKALDALAKTNPQPNAGRVAPELQALRDAVESAAKKGENVEGIAAELAKVETAIAGRVLKPQPRPKPQPQPEPPANPGPNPILRPPGLRPPAGVDVPFPNFPNPGIGLGGGGGIDVETFNKAMELRKKAVELMLKDPNDPDVLKEAQKLQAEAAELMLKAARGLAGGGGGGLGGIQMMPFPEIGRGDFGRIPERARFGIRMERVPAIAAEQLGLEPNTGIAVSQVSPGSVAEKAGLKVHDIILQFAGKPVTDNTEDFIAQVNAVKAGEKIDLVVMRKGKKVEVKGVELPAAGQARGR